MELTSGQLGLDAGLEARLGLGHELRAHVVPRRVVGRGDGDRGVAEVADLDLWEGLQANVRSPSRKSRGPDIP